MQRQSQETLNFRPRNLQLTQLHLISISVTSLLDARMIGEFQDSGATVWLVLDGIPQKELDSLKLHDGIKISSWLGVASGKTAEAEAEWSSLIPLQDRTFQCVRGLTMKTLTGQMPMMDLNPALDYIKRIALKIRGFKT